MQNFNDTEALKISREIELRGADIYARALRIAKKPDVRQMLGLILGGFFYIVRPLLKLLTIPIGCLTMGLFSLALDTGVIYLMSLYLPGFSLDGPEWALAIAGILMILRCPVLR